MPKCVNGHDCEWAIFCPRCGAAVSYRQDFEQLAELPSVEVGYEQTAVLFVGLHRAELPGAYTAEVLLQESPETTGRALGLRMIAGATWLDYYRAYKQEVSLWLRLVGFGRARYRTVVVDTSKFLSVLALDAVDQGTIVLALTPSRDSTPIEQNTSYVALRVALRRGLPVILATNRYVRELTFVKKGQGLITGQDALAQIVEQLLVRSVRNVQDFLAVDSRLGVRVHCFSAVMSASNGVYKSYEDVFQVQEFENSLEAFPEEVHTAYLLGSARRDVQSGIGQAFERYTKQIQRLTSAQAAMSEKNDRGTYDVLLLFGVDESPMDAILKEGYLSVAERAGNLTVEEILQ